MLKKKRMKWIDFVLNTKDARNRNMRIAPIQFLPLLFLMVTLSGCLSHQNKTEKLSSEFSNSYRVERTRYEMPLLRNVRQEITDQEFAGILSRTVQKLNETGMLIRRPNVYVFQNIRLDEADIQIVSVDRHGYTLSCKCYPGTEESAFAYIDGFVDAAILEYPRYGDAWIRKHRYSPVYLAWNGASRASYDRLKLGAQRVIDEVLLENPALEKYKLQIHVCSGNGFVVYGLINTSDEALQIQSILGSKFNSSTELWK